MKILPALHRVIIRSSIVCFQAIITSSVGCRLQGLCCLSLLNLTQIWKFRNAPLDSTVAFTVSICLHPRPLRVCTQPQAGVYGYARSRRRASAHRGEAPLYTPLYMMCMVFNSMESCARTNVHQPVNKTHSGEQHATAIDWRCITIFNISYTNPTPLCFSIAFFICRGRCCVVSRFVASLVPNELQHTPQYIMYILYFMSILYSLFIL